MSTATKVRCDLCPRLCRIGEGQAGFCGARGNVGGKIVPLAYGEVVSLALDPIEKKPLAFFHPGSRILSAGSFGCNMNCPFCQNHELARAGAGDFKPRELSPDALVELALSLRPRGNIGLAFTYNEPLINFEYVRDCCERARAHGLATVLVSNGQINAPYLGELLPHVSAWNIDLKVCSEEGYEALGGDLGTTLHTIEEASKSAHVELTTLVVPGLSDDLKDFRREVDFISGLDPEMPLHLSRYFPSYHWEAPPTPVGLLREMKAIAEEKLTRVLLGNVW